MSFQTIASESEAPNKLTLSDNGVLRRTEYHQPSAWGDYFLSNLSNILVYFRRLITVIVSIAISVLYVLLLYVTSRL